MEDSFRFAPSVSAKILRLKLFLIQGNLEESQNLLLELLKEHSIYTSFIFVSLTETKIKNEEMQKNYFERLSLIRDFFLKLKEENLVDSPSVVLSKIRLLKDDAKLEEAYHVLKKWMDSGKVHDNEVLKVEYVKLLIQLDKKDEALAKTSELLKTLHSSLTRHFCKQCGYNSDEIFWRCPQCREWETIQFRWKV